MYVTKPYLPPIQDVVKQLETIWASQRLTNSGPLLVELEEKIQAYLSSPYTSIYSNGTMALQLACAGLKLTGEVITTPFTFPATTHALHWNNLTPVFCDIDPNTLNINPYKIEEQITPQTSAILAVHVFGHPCDAKTIHEIAIKHGLKVVYDAAHAFGVRLNGASISTLGDATAFSFHATKLFHTFEGGAISCAAPALHSRLMALRNFGFDSNGDIPNHGTNAKLNELQAAIGLLTLDHVADSISYRSKLTDMYRFHIQDIRGIDISPEMPGVEHNYSFLTVSIDERKCKLTRDEVELALREFNVFARKYFCPLASEYRCYSHYPSCSPANLPEAYLASRQTLSLPLYDDMSEDDVTRVCSMIQSICA